MASGADGERRLLGLRPRPGVALQPPLGPAPPPASRWRPDGAPAAGGGSCGAETFGGASASSCAQPRLGLATLLRAVPPRCVQSFIRYHLSIGFERLWLLFDDPCDPAAAAAERFGPAVSVQRCSQHWWSETREHFSRYHARRHGPGPYGEVVQLHEDTGDVQSRQQIAIDRATIEAHAVGLDWLLHIDADELLYFPASGERRDARRFFAALPEDAQLVRFRNHECVPESWEIDDWFREATLFKPNSAFLRPFGESIAVDSVPWRCLTAVAAARATAIKELSLGPLSEAFRLPQHNFFNAYDVGKSAVRLARGEPPPLPAGVHNFVDDSCQPLSKHFPLGPSAPVVLHYANCGFAAWRSKYELLGRFPTVRGHARVRMPFHLAARELTTRGGEASLRRLYQIFVSCSLFGELPYLAHFGLLVRVEGVKELLDELWRGDEEGDAARRGATSGPTFELVD